MLTLHCLIIHGEEDCRGTSFKYFPSQVARESYLQWLADQEKSRRSGRPPPAATITSGQVSPRGAAPAASATCTSGHVSPRGSSSPRPRPGTAGNSPKAGCSYHQAESSSQQGRDSPKPGSSRGQASATPSSASASLRPSQDHGLGPGFHLRETASFLNGLPPDLFGKILVCHSQLSKAHGMFCFQVWKIGARTLFCIKCWPLVSRSTWRASRSATRRRLRSQGRRLRGRRIRRVESDATSDSLFKPVLNQQ